MQASDKMLMAVFSTDGVVEIILGEGLLVTFLNPLLRKRRNS